MVEIEKLIDAALKEKRLIIGRDRTVKKLKLGKLEKVILASNTPEEIISEIKYLSSLTNTEVIEFEGDNKELGALCRKPFLVAVIGIEKKQKGE